MTPKEQPLDSTGHKISESKTYPYDYTRSLPSSHRPQTQDETQHANLPTLYLKDAGGAELPVREACTCRVEKVCSTPTGLSQTELPSTGPLHQTMHLYT